MGDEVVEQPDLATVTRTLTFESALRYPVSKVEVTPDWKPLTPRTPNTWDRLPLRAEVLAKEAEVTLSVMIPRSVHEGWYSSEVTFQVTPEDKGVARLPLQMSLPVYLQVNHVGVTFQSAGKELTGPLRLLPAQAGAGQARVAAELQLHTAAEKTAVRWEVERIKPAAGVGQPLDPGDGRLAVLVKGIDVLPQKGPSSPISRDQPGTVTLRMSHAGLAPGLYRSALRFRSYEDLPGEQGGKGPPGLTNDLGVELLVPGREVKAAVVPDGRPQLGKASAIQVTVACYDCVPGRGELRVLDDAGNALEPLVAIEGPPIKKERDPHLPELSWHTYLVKVIPKRAGKNRFQIHWPGLKPQALKHVEVVLDALGLIEVKQSVLYVEEETVFRATLDPRQVPESGKVVLHAVNDREPGQQPFTIELYDNGNPENGDDRAGDGVFSGRCKFSSLGKFTISPPAGLTLEPVIVQVGFKFDCPRNLGVVEYGGGAVQELFQIPKDLTAPQAIKLSNKLPATCRWRARVRFPTLLEDSWHIAERDLYTLPTRDFDPQAHLDTRLIANSGVQEGGADWQLSGVLRQDEELSLGILSSLPQPAWKELDGGNVEAGAHPTFSKDNGMVLEVELEWVDEDGRVLARRRVLSPFTVGTRYWVWNAKPILAALGVVALLLFVCFGVPALRRRWKSGAHGQDTQNSHDLLPATQGGPEATASKPGLLHRLGQWLGSGRSARPQKSKQSPGVNPANPMEHGDTSLPSLLPPAESADDVNDLLPPDMR